MKLKNNELLLIEGGAISISASLLSALSRGITVLFELGRAVGSSIRRAISKTTCTL